MANPSQPSGEHSPGKGFTAKLRVRGGKVVSDAEAAEIDALLTPDWYREHIATGVK
ncbi:hypothetical protein MesoLjLc_58950 [Mesorhizobium sp. L-8-10]|uniref:hypothetical protein n=1 Tax=Mesorhizobium sp. L-8-10 TaxID=2744523 RepID=UPI0019273E88|nr:hypothetical protein [Mesorhizobium sp. L-8-10]BCH33965.1 hypothetical protein MesoLjLc_58950 [Mesorhizobium sp. L-8-10]